MQRQPRNSQFLLLFILALLVCTRQAVAQSEEMVSGCIVFPTMYIEVFLEKEKVSDAQEICELRGMNLTRISSQEEQEAVVRFMEESDVEKDMWIGVEDVGRGGSGFSDRFTFVDRETIGLDFVQVAQKGDFPWRNDDPSTSDDEKCVKYVSLCLSCCSNLCLHLDSKVATNSGKAQSAPENKGSFVDVHVIQNHQHCFQQVHHR